LVILDGKNKMIPLQRVLSCYIEIFHGLSNILKPSIRSFHD